MNILKSLIRSIYQPANGPKPDPVCQPAATDAGLPLVDLYSSLSHGGKNIVNQRAAELARRLNLADSERGLSSLRVQLSLRAWGWDVLSWRRINPADILSGIEKKENRFALLAVGTFHPNGYYRERCLTALADYGGRALPFTVMLVNDWVDIIRHKADKISHRLLAAADLSELAEALPYINALNIAQRCGQKVSGLLFEAATYRLRLHKQDISVDFIQTRRLSARRILQRLVLQDGLLMPEQELELFDREIDTHNKILLAGQLLKNTVDPASFEARLLKNKISQLRYMAVNNRWQREGRLWPEAEAHLFDPSRKVRELARYLFKGEGNLPERYSRRLEQCPSPAVILGLAETGGQNAVDQIKPFLESDNLQMVKAALTALVYVLGIEADEDIYPFLLKPQTCRLVCRLLKEAKIQYPSARLYNDACQADDPMVKLGLLMLLDNGGIWNKLSYMIRLLDDPWDDFQAEVLRRLNEWRAPVYGPTPAELRALAQVLPSPKVSRTINQAFELSVKATEKF